MTPTPEADLRAYLVSDLRYSKKSCKNKQLRMAGRNFCGDNNDALCPETCSRSWLKTESWRSPDAACRCNPKIYWFEEPAELTNEECAVDSNDEGCEDQNDGYGVGTCHVSYPYRQPRNDRTGGEFRCKYPFEMV